MGTVENKNIEKIIEELKQKTIELPDWETQLKQEYYPNLHEVMNSTIYPDKPAGRNLVRVTRITRGLQRRSVNIMTGLMFGLPVERVYSARTEEEKRAAAILEEIYEANSINSVNMDRGKRLFGACEFATLWYAKREDNELYGEPGLLKIKCRTFSPMDGDKIYPIFDEYGDLISLSFEYTRKEKGQDVVYFDAYTANDHTKFVRRGKDWEVVTNEKLESIKKIPAVYGYRSTPIWENSNNVSEIEWACSRNGNYLRRNSVPVFEISEDEDIEFGKENDDEERIILKLSSKGRSEYKTWSQAIDSLKFHVENLENSFFTDIQLPNFSFSEMKAAGASGESKRYMFVDAHIKVLQEQGIWLDLFRRELNVIKAFAKASFPSLSKAFDSIRVKHIIKPFEIANETQAIENIAMAVNSKIASVKTGIARLGWVNDIDQEIDNINEERLASITEPTI